MQVLMWCLKRWYKRKDDVPFGNLDSPSRSNHKIEVKQTYLSTVIIKAQNLSNYKFFPSSAKKNSFLSKFMTYNSNRSSGPPIRIIVVAIISLIFLGISFKQMWSGYTHIAGSGSAFMASLAIVLGLFFTNLWFAKEMSGRRENAGKLLLAYILLTFLSFAGNFNAFYSYFMNDDVVAAEVTEKHDKFNALSEKALTSLTDQKEVTLKGIIRTEKEELERQIRDKEREGFGDRAKKVLREIESNLVLKVPLTELSDKNTPDYLVANYNQMVDQAFESRLNAIIPKRAEKKDLINSISTLKEELDGKVLQSQKNIKSDGLATVYALVEGYKTVGNKTSNLVKDFSYDKGIEVENLQVGTIPHSFGIAFGKNIGKVSTWFLTFISLFIDLGIPLFTFLVTKQEKSTEIQHPVYRHQ